MARWELMTAHYLNTAVPTEWEYKETNTETGRQARKVMIVPDYMEEGTIVCQGDGERGDIEFIGKPTPDMSPLDPEAEAISDKYRAEWIHPIESISNKIELDDMTKQMMAEFAKQIGVAMVPNTSASQVSAEDFAKLQEQVAALAARNAELEKAQPARRA